ncbi:DUF6326 family protein [Methanococcoides methylutens]|uniref:Uncharacterized protein n=1 Tax=Methanococcoides methylutens MM1 TaxID=1434104 RepID=A0A0E3X0A8_METMT|nr:DUF6326 family protein [Methanococcoides methylutens]AKB85104.1 hypothetical protein MCMEM_1051 [Methanococcoides methylutens MM1]
MNPDESTPTFLEDVKINVKIKLSALWVAVLGLYIYADFFYLFLPGEMENMMTGYMGPFPATQMALLSAMVLMMIPILMIFMSLVLPAKANRWTNIIVGTLYVVVGIGTMMGESWAFYILGHSVVIMLLLLIVGYAWKWPKQEA